MTCRKAVIGLVSAAALSASLFGATAQAASDPTFVSGRLPGANDAAKAATVIAGLTTRDALVAGQLLHFAVAGHHASPSSAINSIGILSIAGTTITLSVPRSVNAGQSVVIRVTLRTPYGPIRKLPIHLLFSGRQKILLETNAAGLAIYRLHRNFPAGNYVVTADYLGSRRRGLYPVSASAVMTIQPLDLTLQALPALPGITLAIDKKAYKTDANGAVQVEVGTAGYHTLSVSTVSQDPNMRLSFVEWANGSPSTTIRYHLLGDETLYMSFVTSFRTPLRIVDAGGNPIDTRWLGDVLANGPGNTDVTLGANSGTEWLDLPAPSRTSLTGVPNNWHYSIALATYHGTSVANRGDSPFVPASGRTWVIKLRLYVLNVHVRRPIFGVGLSSVVVTSQAGLRQAANLDAAGNATFNDLPRGEYVVTMVGPGYSLPVDITMTRNQSFEAPATSLEELFLALGSVVMIVVGLGFLAWRRLQIRGGLERAGRPRR